MRQTNDALTRATMCRSRARITSSQNDEVATTGRAAHSEATGRARLTCRGAMHARVGSRARTACGARSIVYTIHATKNLLDRVKQPIVTPAADTATALGNWYATAIFWKPQVALFVNERTLLPVMMPLAPATDLGARFPAAMCDVLAAHDVNPAFVKTEAQLMGSCGWSKTKNRSVVGIMNEFIFLSEHERHHRPAISLLDLSIRLASTPCGPLWSRHISPDRELRALVDQHVIKDTATRGGCPLP